MMGFVATVDVLAGPGVGLLPLLSLGPAFASLTGTPRRTTAIGVLALAFCVFLGFYNDLFHVRRGYTALLSVAGVSVAALAATADRRRREAELDTVRSVAEAAQRVLLRPVPLVAGNLRISVSYTSAAAEARIGGDLYEVVAADGAVRIIVGDVQGKGLEAVETAAVVLGAFREAAHDEPDLVSVSSRLERALNRRLSGEEFVTAVLVEVKADRKVTLLNYGHPAPLILRADGTFTLAEPPGNAPPLGLAEIGPIGPLPYRVPLAPGDQMLLYTDGVTEARDRDRHFYPLDERTHLLKDADPDAALEALRKDLEQHTGGPLHDDAAMLLIRYRGPA
ncbi:PP2C family protein-serine/threonine phosphatase [Actinacidiphila sp. bgisy160]|uniref:PP2C family protein-serine/threonine phosphatase n=1 Tax=Actinacidiphila sp. bgisy160 TaxID=3413796 RepID=UPI003D736B3D